MPILSYWLEYDEGAGDNISWTTLVGNPSESLVLEYLVTGGAIIGGNPYQFRVRAKNALGWGPPSAIAIISASAAPGQMSTAQTQVDPGDDLAVRIFWNAPTANYDSITEYEVLVRHSDDITYSEETISCDGTANSDMLNNRECSIPFTTLRSSFGL